jgi:hypothetical protein
MHFLFLFMDGIGLGNPDPLINPFFKAEMPNLRALLDGNKLVTGITPLESERATLIALDASLGIPGLPQSATGQATLLTGRNIPQEVGEHYGPKPHKPVRELLAEGSIFSALKERGYKSALLNAYPDSYFERVDSGLRLYSAIPLAVSSAGIPLKTIRDLHANQALSADFTGKLWKAHFKDSRVTEMSPHQAGRHLVKLATSYDFAFFDYWPSDYAGHKQNMQAAVEQLENFDGVLGGLLSAWEDEQGLILITSDHGNLEDLSTRRHTYNHVPALLIGASHLRNTFCAKLQDLSGIAPAILRLYP